MILPLAVILPCTSMALLASSLTLEDAQAAALANAPMLQASFRQVDAAFARQTQAGWRKAGTLETGVLYTPIQKGMHIDIPSLGPGIPPLSFEFSQIQQYAFSSTYTLPLWTGGALENAHEASKCETKAAQSSSRRLRSETLFQANQAYCQAYAALRGVEVAEEMVGQQKAFLSVAQSRVRAKSAARLDELKAELALAKAESDLLETRNRAYEAREWLVSATLDPRFRTAALREPGIPASDLPEELTALKRAYDGRKDLQALRHQVEALNFGIKAARATRFPSIAFKASLTQQSSEMKSWFNTDSQFYSVGLAVSWDGLETARSRAKTAELTAQAMAISHHLRAQEEAVSLDVRSALHKFKEARERILVQERAVVVAEEQARIARLAYREGVAISLEAQEAELALSAAKFNHIRAKTDAAIAAASVKLAMGE